MEKEHGKNRLENSFPSFAEQSDAARRSGGGIFEIRVRGHLNGKWSDWLEGLAMKLLDNGEMILFGPVADQAALMGVLNKLSRLNLTLLSVNEVKRQD